MVEQLVHRMRMRSKHFIALHLRILNSLNIPLSLETVCVFTAPIFSANAAWATYLLTKEVKGTGAGLTAAALLDMMDELLHEAKLYRTSWQLLHFLKDYIFLDRYVWTIFG
ncbi:hypothetical protein ACSBR2_016421 [Camellia fascicularis]